MNVVAAGPTSSCPGNEQAFLVNCGAPTCIGLLGLVIFSTLTAAFFNARFSNQAEEQGGLGSEQEGAVQFSSTAMPLFAPGPSDTKLPTRYIWQRPSKLGLRETSLLPD